MLRCGSSITERDGWYSDCDCDTPAAAASPPNLNRKILYSWLSKGCRVTVDHPSRSVIEVVLATACLGPEIWYSTRLAGNLVQHSTGRKFGTALDWPEIWFSGFRHKEGRKGGTTYKIIEPKNPVNCTIHDFLTRDKRKNCVEVSLK